MNFDPKLLSALTEQDNLDAEKQIMQQQLQRAQAMRSMGPQEYRTPGAAAMGGLADIVGNLRQNQAGARYDLGMKDANQKMIDIIKRYFGGPQANPAQADMDAVALAQFLNESGSGD